MINGYNSEHLLIHSVALDMEQGIGLCMCSHYSRLGILKQVFWRLKVSFLLIVFICY